MIRRTGRGNRVALLLIGLALLLGGAVGLLRGLNVRPGWLGAHHALVIDQPTRHWVAGQSWFWPTVAAVSVLVFLLALWWLIAQGQTRTLRRVALEPDARHGATYLPARAVTSAIENDLAASPYVRHSTAALTGTASSPRLALSVTMAADADPAEAVRRIGLAVQRLREALEDDELEAIVRIRAGRPVH